MKTLKNLLLSIVVLAMVIGCGACDFTAKPYEASDVNYFNFTELDDGTYAIALKEGAEIPETLKLPKEYNGKKVTAISEKGFYQNTKLKNITIPADVKTIGTSAFFGNTALTDVNLYNGVENIGEASFYDCKNLKSISLPKSLKTIGKSAFAMSGLAKVKCNDKLTTVGEFAFSYCGSLKEVYISHSVSSLAENAFAGCKDITYTISEGNVTYKLVDGKPVKR